MYPYDDLFQCIMDGDERKTVSLCEGAIANGYHPMDIYNSNPKLKKVLDQLIDGTYSNGDRELFRDLYDSLLHKDVYFTLKDFDSYADAQKRVNAAYKDQAKWAEMVILNTACSGKFSSDRTIEQYAQEIWKLEKVTVNM